MSGAHDRRLAASLGLFACVGWACGDDNPGGWAANTFQASDDDAGSSDDASMEAPLVALELDQDELVLDIGSLRSVAAFAVDDDGVRTPVTTLVEWSTSDDTVLSVGEGGTVFGWAMGEVEVTASLGELEVSLPVRVRGWSPLERLLESDAQEQATVVDARGGHAVLVHATEDGRTLHMYAPEHGWSGGVPFPSDFAYQGLSVTMSSDRRVLLLWVADDGSGLWTRTFAAEGGFSPPVELGCPGACSPADVFVRDVAVDARAERAVVLLSHNGVDGEPLGLYVMRWSAADGWSPMVPVDTAETRAHRTRSCVSLDEQGRALVLYREHARFTSLHTVTGDAAGAWSEPTLIYEAPEDFSDDPLFIGVPRCSVGPQGTGVLAWNLEAIAHGWAHLFLHDVVDGQLSGASVSIDAEPVLVTPPTVATDDAGSSFVGRMHYDGELVFELFRHEPGKAVAPPSRERWIDAPVLRATEGGTMWLFASGSDSEVLEHEARWFARRFDPDSGWQPRVIFPGVRLAGPRLAAARDGTLVLSFEHDRAIEASVHR